MNILEGAELQHAGMIPAEALAGKTNIALGELYRQLGPLSQENTGLGKAIIDYTRGMGLGSAKNNEVMTARALIERNIMRPLNERAAKVRNLKKWTEAPEYIEKDAISKAALRKATLDVGTLTNFASITGGQSLGYVSLDTRMARGTVRPNSFTLYQALEKSLAWQVVDYWAIATATGGALPGAAFANYTSVSSGSLVTNAGQYQLSNITLKLALDGRAITTALAAQNNYVNISEQETVNAALSVLSTNDFACYWGDSTIWSGQFDGIYRTLVANGLFNNIFDFQKFSAANASQGWSNELMLYNLIYEAAAQITSFGTFGRITHAFMSPVAMGSIQGLTTTQLNNVLSQITEMQDRTPLVVNGNLIGMQTRLGHIQFPLDLFIDARNIPAQGILQGGVSQATTTNPTPPATVTASIVTGSSAAGSEWTGNYVGSSAAYYWAVASTNSNMTESVLTYTSSATTVTTSGSAVQLAIAPPGDVTAASFRAYRSGQGYTYVSTPDPTKFRYIGSIVANGSSTVNFIDLNGGGGTFLPGSTSIFLLDMDPVDLAIDYRMMLPLVRIELFASNLFMPWAVADIGAVRLRVPQFHGLIRNYLPSNPLFNPLLPNT